MHVYEATDAGVIACHFVEMTTRPGELRPTRISDFRKWRKEGRKVVPSVTEIGKVLDKPALVNWKVEQFLKQAFIVDQRCDSFDAWASEVKRLTELQMDLAPSVGTDVHKVLEDYATGKDVLSELRPLCNDVFMAIEAYAGRMLRTHYKVEPRFATATYGGQVDLVGNGWLIDYKTKQTADKFKPGKMAYDEHRMQLAAYRMGMGMPSARAANVFISIEDGRVDFHEHTAVELDKGWRLFEHALAIWQLQNEVSQC